MKNFVKIFSLIFCLSFSFHLFAHGGRLNSAGCHNVTKTGGYHCHRGGSPSSDNDSSSNNNNNDVDNNENKKTEVVVSEIVEGTFPTQIEGLIIKNFRCENNWKVDMVNKSTNKKVVFVTFYTMDSDGDPLISQLFTHPTYSHKGLKINELSRVTFNLKKFSCSIKFNEINFLVKS